jgi:hypothetical protein
MRPWIVLSVAAAVPAVVGCVPAAHSSLRASSHAAGEPPRAARAPFQPGRFDAVFVSAVRAVRARGWKILSCDPDLGSFATAATESDAPCGASTCLARQRVAVKLGYRRARVTLIREVWDTTLRSWRVLDDPKSVATIDREERELLEETMRLETADGAPRLAEACGPSVCDPGTCLASAPVVR